MNCQTVHNKHINTIVTLTPVCTLQSGLIIAWGLVKSTITTIIVIVTQQDNGS